jgi:hypothetical protein
MLVFGRAAYACLRCEGKVEAPVGGQVTADEAQRRHLQVTERVE